MLSKRKMCLDLVTPGFRTDPLAGDEVFGRFI